jgi:hypothetical protein
MIFTHIILYRPNTYRYIQIHHTYKYVHSQLASSWPAMCWWLPYTRLCAIILRWYAIISTIISSIILRLFYEYTRLFYRLYAIISRRRQTENGNVQTAILHPIMEEWLVSVYEGCLRICIDWKARRQNGKLPDGALAFLHYYTHYFFYYTHYFSWLILNVGSVGSSYALRSYAHPFWV